MAKSPFAWVVLHYINVLNKPLSDPRVRRAMRMAVDTNEVIQKAAFGAAVPSGPVPTGYGDWYIDPKNLPYLKADVEGAKKALQKGLDLHVVGSWPTSAQAELDRLNSDK